MPETLPGDNCSIPTALEATVTRGSDLGLLTERMWLTYFIPVAVRETTAWFVKRLRCGAQNCLEGLHVLGWL